jgi:homopolymeric O-antigen transport system ATP-binding protein
MTTAIRVENLSKAYQIGQIGTGTISLDIERWFVTKIMGREDPFLKLGQVNDRTTKGDTDIVWSLKDINLEIEQGDAVGIIGRNGAGKSTLLKLLSRVTAPTTGKIKIKGRVASLLEVGTGFHPELTGRENTYLNGSILGMRKKEIDRKFDEIVDFSGIERYIDTPVKRYSSGMSVRLAFAVAAHLESEILIVDEVLAVGDAEFQKKCLGKMNEVSSREGRTILFVSHNMSAVHSLCDRGILIDSGKVEADCSAIECIGEYSKRNSSRSVAPENGKESSTGTRISGVRMNDQLIPMIAPGENFTLTASVLSSAGANPTIILIINNANGQQVVHCRVFGNDIGLENTTGESVITLSVPPLWLAPGVYSAYFKMLISDGVHAGRSESERITFEVNEEFDDGTRGILAPQIDWHVENSMSKKSEIENRLTPIRNLP